MSRAIVFLLRKIKKSSQTVYEALTQKEQWIHWSEESEISFICIAIENKTRLLFFHEYIYGPQKENHKCFRIKWERFFADYSKYYVFLFGLIVSTYEKNQFLSRFFFIFLLLLGPLWLSIGGSFFPLFHPIYSFFSAAKLFFNAFRRSYTRKRETSTQMCVDLLLFMLF